MTTHVDPPRWVDSPADAPSALREAFAAARNEGPSDAQIAALAAAIAVAPIAATTAVVAGKTLTAKAGVSSVGGGLFAKAAASTVAAALLATSSYFVLRDAPKPSANVASKPSVVAAAKAPEVEREAAPSLQPAAAVVAPSAEPALGAPAIMEAPVEPSIDTPSRMPAGRATQERARPQARAARTRPASIGRSTSPSIVNTPDVEQPAREEPAAIKPQAQASEVQLLSLARAALERNPAAALRHARQHRALYPNGTFAQERDAIAIEALTRTGDLASAKQQAKAFVARYPNSAHAHRFRESFGL